MVSFSYVNVAGRAPVALGWNRSFCGLTKPPLLKAPWNAALARREEGRCFWIRSPGLWERKDLETHFPKFRFGID